MTDFIDALTLEMLRDLLHELGFRATVDQDANGVPRLRSATGGMAFEARLGNLSADGEAVDARLVAAVTVEGELDLAAVNAWNNARRFCRLHLEGGLLLLDMDVSVAEGVSPAHLSGQIELWCRLVDALVAYLREGLAPATRRAAAE